MESRAFNANQLRVVRTADPVLHHVGAFVRLNSGGPVGLVTARNPDDRLTVSWPDGTASGFPEVCLSTAVSTRKGISK